MNVRIICLLKLLIVWQCIGCSKQHENIPSSPCPKLFQYLKDENDEIYGVLRLPVAWEDKMKISVELIVPARDSVSIQRLLVV